MNDEEKGMVSPDTVDTNGPAAPEAEVVTEPVNEPVKKLRIVDRPIEERRAYWRGTQEKSRTKAAVKAEKAARQPDSTEELRRKDAKQVLLDRGLSHAHVIDCVLDLAEVAATAYKIPFNWHLLRYGLRATLAALDGVKPTESREEDHDVIGELISHRHLYSLWDFGLFRKDVSFEEYLNIRNEAKKSCFILGRDLLGKDFHEKPHGSWADFLPSFNPDILKPNFTQEEMKAWISEQGIARDYLLMSSRNAYKSTFISTWLVTAILACPSIRILIISETKALSKGFIRLLRSTFEIKNSNEPDTFQQFFYEYCIPVGDGSVLSYECPMRHLSLIQPTAESNSMDSSVVGGRCDLLIGDDPISNATSGTPEACESGIEKLALAKKLIEVGGLSVTVGTPWAPKDLYADMIANSPETGLEVKVDPAWKVKEPFLKDILKMTPEERDKYLFSLTEDMVELLFPSRLTFKFLRKELKSNPHLFVSQNLCVFIAADDASLRVTFTEDALRQHVRPFSFFGEASVVKTIIAVDPAFSISNIADYTSIAVLKIIRWQGTDVVFVADIDCDRWRQSEIAMHFVQAVQKWNPDSVIIEKTGPWEELRKQILTTAKNRQTALPYVVWKNTSLGAGVSGAKVKRIKALELLLTNDRLWFAPSDKWNEQCFDQFMKFHGLKSGPSKKDDIPDSIALAAERGLPKFLGDLVPQKSAEMEKQEADAINHARLRRYQEHLFGTGETYRFEPKPAEPEPDNPLFRGIGQHLRRKNQNG